MADNTKMALSKAEKEAIAEYLQGRDQIAVREDKKLVRQDRRLEKISAMLAKTYLDNAYHDPGLADNAAKRYVQFVEARLKLAAVRHKLLGLDAVTRMGLFSDGPDDSEMEVMRKRVQERMAKLVEDRVAGAKQVESKPETLVVEKVVDKEE